MIRMNVSAHCTWIVAQREMMFDSLDFIIDVVVGVVVVFSDAVSAIFNAWNEEEHSLLFLTNHCRQRQERTQQKSLFLFDIFSFFCCSVTQTVLIFGREKGNFSFCPVVSTCFQHRHQTKFFFWFSLELIYVRFPMKLKMFWVRELAHTHVGHEQQHKKATRQTASSLDAESHTQTHAHFEEKKNLFSVSF